MFNAGDIVVGNERADLNYSTTDSDCLMQVMETYEESIKVIVVGYAREDVLGRDFIVRSSHMELADIPAFLAEHPDYKYDKSVINTDVKNVIKPVFPMNTTYIPTEEEINRLVEGFKRLNKYGYTMTTQGIKYILREFFKNKGWIINLMKNHPNYIPGKYQIAWKEDFPRNIDYDTCHEFGYWIRNRRKEILQRAEVPEGTPCYDDVMRTLRDLDYIITRMMELNNKSELKVNLGGFDIEHYIDEKTKYLNYREIYMDETKYYLFEGEAFTPQSIADMNALSELSRILRLYKGESTINEEMAEELNECCGASAVAGQKLSRAVNKILIACGMDKLQDVSDDENNIIYESKEKAFAKFSDAVSPRVFSRPTVISCNPIDFLTMSFGNSWQSCMTIDKHNYRGIDADHTYHGTKSGGTLSYMMDGATLMLYTVRDSYTGNEYEFEDKINRNLFHIGHDKIVQGRIYPQSTDGANDFYTKLRSIFQKKLKECLGMDDIKWVVSTGIRACDRNTCSYGVHYRDYVNFDNCNVSYMVVDGVKHNFPNSIEIGHISICPSCGKEHEYDENIMCSDCVDNYTKCYDCSERLTSIDERENMVIVPDSYGETRCYCPACARTDGYTNENPFRGIVIPASELTENVA